MFKKVHLTLTALLCTTVAFAQSGSIQVHMIDKANPGGIPFANVVVYKAGTQVQSGVGTTDINGYCTIKPLDPGRYDIKAVEEGDHDFVETGVIVTPNNVAYVKAAMVSTATTLKAQTVIAYKVPLVTGNTQQGRTITRKDIQRMAVKNPNDIIAGTPGLYQKDVGGSLNAEGARSNSTEYIVDGRKVEATDIFGNQSVTGVPQSMYSQVTAITGGIPAKYGDATGAIIEINTIDASPKFFGSIQGISSQFLDAFGYNDVNFAVGGPIWSKMDTSTHTKNPIIDFVLGGEYTHQKDNSPSFVGGYTTNSDTLSKIQEHPYVVNPAGGYLSSADYITANQITHTKYLPDDPSQSISLNGKLDFHVTKNVNITAGGTYQYNNSRYFEDVYELYNANQNPLNLESSWDGYVRIMQRFPTPQTKNKQSLIQNAYYTIQAEYSGTHNTFENYSLKDNLFAYGYVGKFQQDFSTLYTPAPTQGKMGLAYYETTPYGDSLYTFTPGSYNPIAANYTSQLYSLIGQQNITNENVIQENNGMLNGSTITDVYSLWFGPGHAYPAYYKTNNNHLRFTAEFSADIKKHSIQVGFEYEQNVISYWSINAEDLWNVMRQNVNLQIANIDTTAYPTRVKQGTYDTYNFPLKYDSAAQTQFDKSMRQKLGLPVNGSTYLQPDNYDPSFFSLDMFSADNLLNNGSSLVGYMGYTYLGNKGSGTSSIDDFLNQVDGNGNHTYPIAPFHPIYMAGYIQDHFDYKNLKFDVGVRVDRYDANQPVLKDPYLLQPAKTVSELPGTPLDNVPIPSDIKSNYVVYVNDAQSPSAIVGFRNGNTWYNAQGTIISDPSVLAAATTTGNIQPYLENPNQTGLSSAVFTTYTPQVNVMPRIAFAFPISDVAQFFAHYDVLTQRPPISSGTGQIIPLDAFSPIDYMFITSRVGQYINNPDLLPQQTIDYELGYTQVLNEKKTAALTLRAFYRENRNNIEVYQYLDAYPTTYLSFSNIDFGTTKGLSIGYDLRRVGNFKLRASYTLMFANGTGSGPTSGINLASSGQPNLQIPQPLDYDQRHTFVVNLDYHYSSGTGYNGPVISKKGGKSIQLLANAGFNLNFTAGSGTPYTRQSNATQTVTTGTVGRAALTGSINGAYMPWQYRVDLRVDKDFPLTLPGKGARKADLLVYIEATNLLNTENILNVYHYTGNATDDGYLASLDGQQYVAQQADPQAFSDQYKIKEQQASYLSIPRELRLGVEFNF